MLEGLGVKTQPVDFRFGQMASQLQRWILRGGGTTQMPLIFLGAARDGHEVGDFQHQLKNIQHPIGVLVSPSDLAEVRINGPLRTQHFLIDSAAIGDVIGGSWGVFLCTRKPLILPTVGYAT